MVTAIGAGPEVPAAPPRGPRNGSRVRRAAGLRDASPLTYGALIVAGVLSVFPLYWMFIVATRGNEVVAMRPPPVLPGSGFGENTARLFDNQAANFTTGLINSAIASTIVAFSVVFFCSLAGFALAKLPFRGRNAITIGVIGTMMVPVQMGVIPLLIMMESFGWRGDIKAVIVPFLVSGFGVFMMRQYAQSAVPTELIEAARVDGCSTFRIYLSVVLPALRPAMVVLGLLTFMTMWNEFIWPLAVLNPDNPTVQFSINQLNQAYSRDYALMFTGATFSTLPLLIVFVFFGRRLIGGIMEGAVKA
ncbi:cellobiose ABC transporter membrane protein [Murinocardiopsis flavida]|uniref:Cellobiose ABC transporter membrane protein n=1 Tax=Murinocardiopsis flavida TaxID=645275 RepID=A0A2P8DGV6_9ACTN|nr:carbohydrate ABC transporter permease [Murinocardiopsis flavida]PSK96441.1 cellobiose ABC transporter membrane protein [Murinocardiopsis flavida]